MSPNARHKSASARRRRNSKPKKSGHQTQAVLPISDPFEAVIDHIGQGGDGIAQTEYGPVYVPYTLAGEKVRLKLLRKAGQGWQAKLMNVIDPSTDRIDPECTHFGKCGGCQFQHWHPTYYAEWKTRRLTQLSQREGVDIDQVQPIDISPAHSRRRVHFHLKRQQKGWVIGYYAQRSHVIEPVTACPLLHPDLEAIISPLQQLCQHTVFEGMKQADCQINLTRTGLDLVLGLSLSDRLTPDHYAHLAEWCDQHDIARLHVTLSSAKDAELIPIVTRRVPVMHFHNLTVAVPPGGFLQATAAGEQSLMAFLKTEISHWCQHHHPKKKNWQIADLFCGAGTFTGLLTEYGAVQAFESDPSQIAALQQAGNQAGNQGNRGLPFPLAAVTRDLYRRPLRPDELSLFDIIVLDPPRAGAEAQITELANSDVPLIAMISCHPTSFMRDSQILQSHGYKLARLRPVDQFLWSPHQELAAIFIRNSDITQPVDIQVN